MRWSLFNSITTASFRDEAQMAELVDALVSGTSNRKVVQVRVLFWAQKKYDESAQRTAMEWLQRIWFPQECAGGEMVYTLL